jgi:lipid-binding SYLF domain-containing protein
MMRRIGFFLVALVLLAGVQLAGPPPAFASEQQELVDRAKLTVDRLRHDSNLGKPVGDMLGRAKAVLIVPNLWRAGFILGGSGGSGVLVAKGPDGAWSAPAFYGIGGGSIGFQIGAEMQELMLIILTDGGLTKIMDNQVKIGGDVTFALGPVGAGLGGATTPNFGADLVAYSTSIGLYGGLNLEGGLIAIREEWNRGYYGEGATSREIVFNRRFDNPGAADLRAALAAPPAP